MKRPKNPPVRVTKSITEKEQALEEALGELARFAKWKDEKLESMKANTEFMGQIETICDDLRKNLKRQDGAPAPSSVHKQTTKISATFDKAVRSLEKDQSATESVMSAYEGPEETRRKEFSDALLKVRKLRDAAAKAAASKAPVVKKFFGQKSSAKLIFLYNCRSCMMVLGTRHVTLWKTDGELLRFARPLFKYATGLRVLDGSLDHQIEELAAIPPIPLPALAPVLHKFIARNDVRALTQMLKILSSQIASVAGDPVASHALAEALKGYGDWLAASREKRNKPAA